MTPPTSTRAKVLRHSQLSAVCFATTMASSAPRVSIPKATKSNHARDDITSSLLLAPGKHRSAAAHLSTSSPKYMVKMMINAYRRGVFIWVAALRDHESHEKMRTGTLMLLLTAAIVAIQHGWVAFLFNSDLFPVHERSSLIAFLCEVVYLQPPDAQLREIRSIIAVIAALGTFAYSALIVTKSMTTAWILRVLLQIQSTVLFVPMLGALTDTANSTAVLSISLVSLLLWLPCVVQYVGHCGDMWPHSWRWTSRAHSHLEIARMLVVAFAILIANTTTINQTYSRPIVSMVAAGFAIEYILLLPYYSPLLNAVSACCAASIAVSSLATPFGLLMGLSPVPSCIFVTIATIYVVQHVVKAEHQRWHLLPQHLVQMRCPIFESGRKSMKVKGPLMSLIQLAPVDEAVRIILSANLLPRSHVRRWASRLRGSYSIELSTRFIRHYCPITDRWSKRRALTFLRSALLRGDNCVSEPDFVAGLHKDDQAKFHHWAAQVLWGVLAECLLLYPDDRRQARVTQWLMLKSFPFIERIIVLSRDDALEIRNQACAHSIKVLNMVQSRLGSTETDGLSLTEDLSSSAAEAIELHQHVMDQVIGFWSSVCAINGGEEGHRASLGDMDKMRVEMAISSKRAGRLFDRLIEQQPDRQDILRLAALRMEFLHVPKAEAVIRSLRVRAGGVSARKSAAGSQDGASQDEDELGAFDIEPMCIEIDKAGMMVAIRRLEDDDENDSNASNQAINSDDEDEPSTREFDTEFSRFIGEPVLDQLLPCLSYTIRSDASQSISEALDSFLPEYESNDDAYETMMSVPDDRCASAMVNVWRRPRNKAEDNLRIVLNMTEDDDTPDWTIAVDVATGSIICSTVMPKWLKQHVPNNFDFDATTGHQLHQLVEPLYKSTGDDDADWWKAEETLKKREMPVKILIPFTQDASCHAEFIWMRPPRAGQACAIAKLSSVVQADRVTRRRRSSVAFLSVDTPLPPKVEPQAQSVASSQSGTSGSSIGRLAIFRANIMSFFLRRVNEGVKQLHHLIQMVLLTLFAIFVGTALLIGMGWTSSRDHVRHACISNSLAYHALVVAHRAVIASQNLSWSMSSDHIPPLSSQFVQRMFQYNEVIEWDMGAAMDESFRYPLNVSSVDFNGTLSRMPESLEPLAFHHRYLLEVQLFAIDQRDSVPACQDALLDTTKPFCGKPGLYLIENRYVLERLASDLWQPRLMEVIRVYHNTSMAMNAIFCVILVMILVNLAWFTLRPTVHMIEHQRRVSLEALTSVPLVAASAILDRCQKLQPLFLAAVNRSDIKGEAQTDVDDRHGGSILIDQKVEAKARADIEIATAQSVAALKKANTLHHGLLGHGLAHDKEDLPRIMQMAIHWRYTILFSAVVIICFVVLAMFISAADDKIIQELEKGGIIMNGLLHTSHIAVETRLLLASANAIEGVYSGDERVSLNHADMALRLNSTLHSFIEDFHQASTAMLSADSSDQQDTHQLMFGDICAWTPSAEQSNNVSAVDCAGNSERVNFVGSQGIAALSEELGQMTSAILSQLIEPDFNSIGNITGIESSIEEAEKIGSMLAKSAMVLMDLLQWKSIQSRDDTQNWYLYTLVFAGACLLIAEYELIAKPMTLSLNNQVDSWMPIIQTIPSTMLRHLTTLHTLMHGRNANNDDRNAQQQVRRRNVRASLVKGTELSRLHWFHQHKKVCLVLVASVYWVAWGITVFVRGVDLRSIYDEYSAMALAMAFGSFVAGSTPLGGGAVAFPVISVIYQFPAKAARDFSFCVQSSGMTAAAVFIWLSGEPVDLFVLKNATIGGIFGSVVGSLVLDGVLSPLLLKTFISSVWMGFGVGQVLLSVFASNVSQANQACRRIVLETTTAVEIRLIAIFGGMLAALSGGGIDTLVYSFCILYYNLRMDVAIPTSVSIMGISAFVNLMIRLAVIGSVNSLAIDAWMAAWPVVVFGAPFGVYVIRRRGMAFSKVITVLATLAQYIAILILVASQNYALISLTLIAVPATTIMFYMINIGSANRNNLLAATEHDAQFGS